MEKTYLQPGTLHEPFSNYSHGIVVEGAKRLIFCAGQVAGDKDGNIVGEGDFEAQQRQVMSNLKDVLAEAGATLADVVKVTLYIVNQDDAPKARNILREHFAASRPAIPGRGGGDGGPLIGYWIDQQLVMAVETGVRQCE